MSSALQVRVWKKSKRSIDRQHWNRWNMPWAFLIESNYDLSGDRLVRIDITGKHQPVSNTWTCQVCLRLLLSLAPWVWFEEEQTIPYWLRDVLNHGSAWQVSVLGASANWSRWNQEQTDHIDKPFRFYWRVRDRIRSAWKSDEKTDASFSKILCFQISGALFWVMFVHKIFTSSLVILYEWTIQIIVNTYNAPQQKSQTMLSMFSNLRNFYFYLRVTQSRLNGAPSETRKQPWKFASMVC